MAESRLYYSLVTVQVLWTHCLQPEGDSCRSSAIGANELGVGPDGFCLARLDILPKNVAAKSSVFCRAWHNKLDILLTKNVYFIHFPYNPVQRFIKIAGSVSQHGFPRTCP